MIKKIADVSNTEMNFDSKKQEKNNDDLFDAMFRQGIETNNYYKEKSITNQDKYYIEEQTKEKNITNQEIYYGKEEINIPNMTYEEILKNIEKDYKNALVININNDKKILNNASAFEIEKELKIAHLTKNPAFYNEEKSIISVKSCVAKDGNYNSEIKPIKFVVKDMEHTKEIMQYSTDNNPTCIKNVEVLKEVVKKIV